MKILVVSLLRLGDLIQQIPLIKGIQCRYPQAEIHILVNKQFSHAQSLLSVSRFFYFDREALQKGMGETAYNIMWSHSKVEKLLADLSAEGYDQIYNFTHTKLSAYLIGALAAPIKKGLHHDMGRFQGLDNSWLRYFNDQFSGQSASMFHYVEILGKAFDLPVQKPSVRVGGLRTKRVLFQCLTSDQKKNWGLAKFASLKHEIEKSLVDYQVQILGAPFEREMLLSTFQECDLVIADLSEVPELLTHVDLLVTGDTSIKHLAALVGTPIVEIALGSSDVSKTGAFQQGAIILESKIPCSPCVHSKPCPQSSHLCADLISVGKVFEAVWDLLSRSTVSHKKETDFDRAVFERHLDRGQVLLPLILDLGNLDGVALRTAELKRTVARIERCLPEKKRLAASISLSTDLGELILCAQEILKSGTESAHYFGSFIEALIQKYSNPLQIHSRVTKALEETKELLKIRDEILLQQSQKISKEGEYYAKGIGQLSIGSFEEAGESLQRDYQDADL